MCVLWQVTRLKPFSPPGPGGWYCYRSPATSKDAEDRGRRARRWATAFLSIHVYVSNQAKSERGFWYFSVLSCCFSATFQQCLGPLRCVCICLCEHTCAWCAHASLRISARTRVCVHARAEVSACVWAHVHGAISAREQVVWYDHGHVPTADVTPSRSHSCSCP